MVVSESEIVSQGEVGSPVAENDDHQHKAFSSLGRQSSIYSLTLDEFQHTLCDAGKNFGSMNMDEFLNSIWTAEENQAIPIPTPTNNNNNNFSISITQSSSSSSVQDKVAPIAKHPSLPRQPSLTLPPPLCRKTVDQVWSEIHRTQLPTNTNHPQTSSSAPRQPTFGEMTLEDFLVKAGVVREQTTTNAIAHALAPAPQQQHYTTVYQNNNHPNPNPNPNPTLGAPSYVSRPPPIMGVAACATYPHNGNGSGSGGGGGVGESSVYAPKRNVAPAVCYGGRLGNGTTQAQAMGVEATVSPVSSDGMCTSQIDNGMNQYGMDIGGPRGRKRVVDGPVEKVVERRQRRMIKNRESAARSRARKQAYTVELEAELNQLREENVHLKQALAELERKRKQQYFEEVKMRALTRAHKAIEKLRLMRRTLSSPL